jgi:voltage-gated potassium channel
MTAATPPGVFRRFRRSLLYLATVLSLAVTGYVLYGWSFIDSLYMVVITVFGVGYGEVRPLTNATGKVFTMLVIVGGTSAVVFVIGDLVRFITQGEIMKAIGELRKSRQVEDISGHAIICGFGRIGQALAQELSQSKFPFVIVDLDDTRLALAEESGYLFVKGNATEEETLQRAHVERAAVLATVLPQDTLNVFITLTARNLNRHLRIIARGEQPSTEKKLLQAGADEVVLPATIGGTRIAHSITRPATMKFLGDNRGLISDELLQLGVEIDELRLHKHTHLAGKTILDLQNMSAGNLLAIGLRRGDGSILRSDFMDKVIEPGDSVIIIGRVNALPAELSGEVDREALI